MKSIEEIERWNELSESFWTKRTKEQKWLHNYLLYPFISSIIDSLNGDVVLDFGCTDGEFINYFYESHTSGSKTVFAYDMAKQMLHLAEQNVKRKSSIIKNLRNKKFDIIIANMVFQDIYDLESVLLFLNKHLYKDGIIVASFPNPLKSKDVANHPTARHVFINDTDGEEIIIEKMYWSSDEKDWTYKYHRNLESFYRCFTNSQLIVTNTFFPNPVEEGKCNSELFEDNYGKENTMVVLLRRKNDE